MKHETWTGQEDLQTTGALFPASSSSFGALEQLSFNSPSAEKSTNGDILSPSVEPVNYCFNMNESVETSPQFPAWLRRQLDRRGWTAADLNRESGIATQTISKWLRGERTPRKPELIHKLADSLDVHQDEILERLNMRDGGADRMSLAVRYVAPTIDKYDWDEEELDLIVRYIESLAWMKSRR